MLIKFESISLESAGDASSLSSFELMEPVLSLVGIAVTSFVRKKIISDFLCFLNGNYI